MEASLGNALARAAVAWQMFTLKEPDSTVPDRVLTISPLISFFKALLNVQRRSTPSPNVKSLKKQQPDEYLDNSLTHSVSKTSVASLSFSPFKTPKAFTSFSLDLNRTSRTLRSQSTYRMETDRVNRLTRYCESLERKAQWTSLRESKEAERKRLIQEREEYTKQQVFLERSFQEQLRTKAKVQKLEERKDKDQSRISTREAREKLKRDEAKRLRDDLQRSIEASSLLHFSRSIAEETRKRDKEEKLRENKEFLVARRVSTAARRIVPEISDPEVDLAFKLQQAVLKNQEIVKRIVTNSHLPL